MEHYDEMLKLLSYSNDSKFVARKWIEVNDLSGSQYSVNKNIRFKPLRSNLWDYRCVYIVVNVRIMVEGTNANNRENKMLTFKNNTPFRSCISKFNNTFIDNAEDLDTAMPMHGLLECSDEYSVTSGSLRNHYRNEVNYAANENNANNYRINNNKTVASKSFTYKTKIIGSTPDDDNTLDTEVAVPLKYLSNLRRSLG